LQFRHNLPILVLNLRSLYAKIYALMMVIW
jgi:hypothetical protein